MESRRVGELSYDQLIGSGSFGAVFCGSFNGSRVAIKRVRRNNDVDDKYVIEQEVELLKKAQNHPNILRLIHTEMNDDFVYNHF